MPEGHSVHRLARQFNDVFGGEMLAVSSPQGKFAAGALLINGAVLQRAEAHGKQMFLYFSHDLVLRVHLGLYGAWDFGGDSTFTGASSIGAPRRIGERELAGTDAGGAGAGGIGAGGTGGASGFATHEMNATVRLQRPENLGPREYLGPAAPKGAVRVRLVSDHGWADLRGPTACEVITPEESEVIRRRLGPDPLNNLPPDADEFVRRIRKSSTSIALQLMKQEVLAGVGNVYRAETLFRRGLDPMLAGKSLQLDEARDLWRDITRIMADGVRDGRIITTELCERPSGFGLEVGHGLEAMAQEPSAPSSPASRSSPATNRDVPVEDAHYVYKREGRPCRRCGTTVAMKELGGRKLYWCPSCQRG